MGHICTSENAVFSFKGTVPWDFRLLFFFHESVSSKPLSIPLWPFRNFSKIHGGIRSSRFATGVVDSDSVPLKGQCHEIFCFWFFSWISFPPAPEYPIRTVLNFFENSRRYSQVKVHHRCQRHRWQICLGVNDTGGKLPPVSTTPAANLPPVSTTPAANFATSFPSVVDTGGKFATGVNDTGGKFAAGINDTGGNLPPVSTTPAANLPPVSMTPVANNGNNIRLLRP